MKYFPVALFLFSASVVHAYSPVAVSVEQPFEEIVISMDEKGQKQSYLGTLETYPHLYEFFLTEKVTLEIQTKQRSVEEAVPVNLILLSVDPDTERIAERVRLNTPIEDRTENYVGSLGVKLIESEVVELELEPGLYRLEVSTPLNESPYELDFGVESNENSYFGTFATVWEVQRHFEYWWIRYFISSFILYQLGIVLIVSGLVYTWRKRKEISNAS